MVWRIGWEVGVVWRMGWEVGVVLRMGGGVVWW